LARLPYPDESSPDVAPLVDEVVRTRGKMLNLFRAMLHSPAIAGPWIDLGTAVRYGSGLDDRTRELVICQVAARTGSSYEWHHHAPVASAAGVSEEQLEALPDPPIGLFSSEEEMLLGYVDHVLDGAVDDDAFNTLVQLRGARGAAEITATACFYIGVSRFLSAMGVQVEDEPT
jgi:alkylhydroperoxidase family enzyme